MEFSLRVGDMSFFVFCKFEIVIFKIVQVMTENIPFAFLYVLSILLLSLLFYYYYLFIFSFIYFDVPFKIFPVHVRRTISWWAKTGEPREKPPVTPANRTWLKGSRLYNKSRNLGL